MMGIRVSAYVWLVLALATIARGAEPPTGPFPRTPPLEPDQAEKSFECAHDFEMQLIAHEPALTDPVDMAYDENGQAYVVEMRDYPFPEEKDATPTEFLGQVRLLRDSDGDGRFDESVVFADHFSWPTAVACWRGGVYLAAAPDVFYLKDTDGDGKADERRVVFTGFNRSNVQAIVNNLKWGLDHKIYGSASGNGGDVHLVSDPMSPPVSVTRRDFRFDPRTDALEAISGGARFGNTFDDWGNRFVCNIRNPLQHVAMPQRYLARNQWLALPSVLQDVAESGDQLQVFPISAPEAWRVERAQRWTAERQTFPRSEMIGAGFWTSSSGVTIYRGDAYGEAFLGNAFIGEVAGNLVHRQTVQRDGPTFRSQRADENTEFVRSTDRWFRPVNFVNAPDGTLHVLDMYRETIEHPWSIPDDIKARLDLRSGNDRGRIYRLCPRGFVAPRTPQLGAASNIDLVPYLNSPNAWQRETAHRLLFERQDPMVKGPLEELVRTSAWPQGRLHALWTLDGLGLLDERILLTALADMHAEIRRNAVMLAESRLATSTELKRAVVSLAEDTDAAVRMQVALSLGECPDASAIDALATIALRDASSTWTRAAVLSSAGQSAQPLAFRILARVTPEQERDGAILMEELCALIASDDAQLQSFLSEWTRLDDQPSRGLQMGAVAGLTKSLHRRGTTLHTAKEKLNVEGRGPEAGEVITKWQAIAQSIVGNDEFPVGEWLPAIALLSEQPLSTSGDKLRAALESRRPPELQLAAVQALQAHREPTAAATLMIEQWRSASPVTRRAILEALLARESSTLALLQALEANTIVPGEIDLPQRTRLLKSSNPSIAQRATALFGPSASAARADVVKQYSLQFAQTQPHPERGEILFRRECQTCHKLGTIGGDVGPNLVTVRHRSAEDILTHILDPNRDVMPQFITYRVILQDGRSTVGIIANESDSSLTVRTADNRDESILRNQIEELVSTGQSIMPEGFEQKLQPQEMMDLVGFLLR